MKIPRFSRILCLSLLCSIPVLHAEMLTYQDSFVGKPEELGRPLDSRSVGTGKGVWEATTNTVLAKDGGVRVLDNNPFVARVELPTTFKEVSVEAEVSPAEKGWMSVGIGNGELSNPNFGGLFLMVTTGGNYSLMFNPDPEDARSSKVVALRAGRIRTWKPEALNSLKLVYNKDTDTVSAYANGTEKLAKDVSLKEKSFVLHAEYTGVSGIYQATETKGFGKFSATVQK